MKKLEEYVRSIPDFPEEGIIFRARRLHPCHGKKDLAVRIGDIGIHINFRISPALERKGEADTYYQILTDCLKNPYLLNKAVCVFIRLRPVCPALRSLLRRFTLYQREFTLRLRKDVSRQRLPA